MNKAKSFAVKLQMLAHARGYRALPVRPLSLKRRWRPSLTSTVQPITCSDTTQICATNTLHGVAGCCDPSNLSACTIPTQCIPLASISTLCTGTCDTNPAILKCTLPSMSECYVINIAYSKTSMVITRQSTYCAQHRWELAVIVGIMEPC